MKRLIAFCVLVFLVALGMNPEIMASCYKHNWEKANLRHSMSVKKAAEDDTISVFMYAGKMVQYSEEDDQVYEEYDIVFMLDGDKLRDVKKIQIKNPNNKKLILKNTFGFNILELKADFMSSENFQSKFPVGDYSITFFPSKFGNETISLSYDFPSTPVITYPGNNATNVPLSFTVEWEPFNDIDELSLYIMDDNSEDEDKVYELDLTVDSESVSIPDGVLQSNTQYHIALEAYRDNYFTSRFIHFTTGSE